MRSILSATVCALIAIVAVSASPLQRRQDQLCGNQYYDPTTGCCLDGHVCPLGNQICVASNSSYTCFNPNNFACPNGVLQPNAECGNQWYNPDLGTCFDNEYICPTGHDICVASDSSYSCYLATAYSCVNGVLVAH